MMNLTKRRERLRAVLAGKECVNPAPVFDSISARIADGLGFEIGYMAGAVASAAVLGAPDLLVITMGELAQQVRAICRASSLSLIIDADNGYGNALNVMRTVEELESAGVSLVSIEDTALPIGMGSHKRVERLITLEEGVGKMKAALAARQDPSLIILGHTHAVTVGGTPEAIRRVKAYEKAGVDAIWLADATREGLAAVHAETRLPLLVGQPGTALGDKNFLAANGVRIASLGHLAFLASVKAMYETLKAVRDGKSPSDLRPTLASPELLAQVIHQPQYDEWIKNFMS